jgi:phosphatidylinositol alpha-1,6-mannosyltransferase
VSLEIERIAWNGPAWGAPFYFPFVYRKVARNNARVVHCDDAVTALIGARILQGTTKKLTTVVHGLDVVLPIEWYQKRIRKALGNIDKIICVSRATAAQVKARGIEESRIEIIPNAVESVDDPTGSKEKSRREVGALLRCDLKGKKVLLSIGRPIRRKGFDGFILNAFLCLPDDYIYVIVGSKPTVPAWIQAFRLFLGARSYRLLLMASGCDSIHDDLVRLSRNPRIYYLNGVADEMRNLLLSASDLFIMPNITVEGDMEGFGIVALEAAIRGVPVIATGIEGITDAVIDGENGWCIAEGDYEDMVMRIRSLAENPGALLSLRMRAMEFTQRQFSIEITARKYLRVFEELLKSN